MATSIPSNERFWKYVNQDGPIPAHCPEYGACWLWAGGGSYGRFWDGNRLIGAHRFAWSIQAGALDDGHLICHVCDNKACVRNDEAGIYEVKGVRLRRWGHLFIADHAVNAADAVAKGLYQRGERHHAYLTDAQWFERHRLRNLHDRMRIQSNYGWQRHNEDGEEWLYL